MPLIEKFEIEFYISRLYILSLNPKYNDIRLIKSLHNNRRENTRILPSGMVYFWLLN